MSTTTTTENTQVEYVNTFAPADKSIPYRIVGTYEYLQAAELLTRLLALSTEEEHEAYDELLEERPEFAFYNGPSTQLGINRQSIKFDNEENRKQFDDDFKKSGLAWMLALAKVELGATISMYGEAQNPFAVYAPTDFDGVAFVRLIADDVVAHMRSLAREDGLKEVLRTARRSDTWTLAYLRRIKLIQDMLNVVSAAHDYQADSRIAPLAKELKSLQKKLVRNVIADERRATAIESNQYQSSATGREVMTGVSSLSQAQERCGELVRTINR